MINPTPATFLSTAEWQRRAGSHRERAHRHTLPARMRRDRGLPHPIRDFLFEYYPFPFSLLENWHPGTGVALEMEAHTRPEWFSPRLHTCKDGLLMADPGKLPEKSRQRMAWTLELLEATHDRTPHFACHGMHEWAMVFRGDHVRHEKTLGLRLPQREIDRLVETRPIGCSHHDAFRFFAGEARRFNRLRPDLESRPQMEQPGCLHANMDLYKWTAKSMPWAGSELLLDCFELALELRELDMRASPYDLRPWGREPVCIENAEGRAQYEAEQRRLAAAARPLRRRLIDALRQTLAAPTGSSSSHTLPAEFLPQGLVKTPPLQPQQME
jgi:hypothetical protein